MPARSTRPNISVEDLVRLMAMDPEQARARLDEFTERRQVAEAAEAKAGAAQAALAEREAELKAAEEAVAADRADLEAQAKTLSESEGRLRDAKEKLLEGAKVALT